MTLPESYTSKHTDIYMTFTIRFAIKKNKLNTMRINTDRVAVNESKHLQ